MLEKNGKGVKPVAKAFPKSLKNKAINRKLLGRMVFGDPEGLKKLEAILHPMVRRIEKDFLTKARRKKSKAAILEIPLLFETGAQKRCDYTICVTAPPAIQKARVMQRKDMTAARFKAIVQRQMPDVRKRKLADFTVETGKNYRDTRKQLKKICQELLVL